MLGPKIFLIKLCFEDDAHVSDHKTFILRFGVFPVWDVATCQQSFLLLSFNNDFLRTEKARLIKCMNTFFQMSCGFLQLLKINPSFVNACWVNAFISCQDWYFWWMVMSWKVWSCTISFCFLIKIQSLERLILQLKSAIKLIHSFISNLSVSWFSWCWFTD